MVRVEVLIIVSAKVINSATMKVQQVGHMSTRMSMITNESQCLTVHVHAATGHSFIEGIIRTITIVCSD